VHRTLLRLGQVLSLVALLATFGGHWVVLQSFAWVTMLVENAETAPLSVAVEKTFDGQHPCAICKSIASAKGKEAGQQKPAPVSKLTLFWERSQSAESPLREVSRIVPGGNEMETRSAAPIVPPPKSVTV